jgi:hypothetical protein
MLIALTKASPAKANPFQKSAENRSAFLRAISRSPSPDRSLTPFTAKEIAISPRREMIETIFLMIFLLFQH